MGKSWNSKNLIFFVFPMETLKWFWTEKLDVGLWYNDFTNILPGILKSKRYCIILSEKKEKLKYYVKPWKCEKLVPCMKFRFKNFLNCTIYAFWVLKTQNVVTNLKYYGGLFAEEEANNC